MEKAISRKIALISCLLFLLFSPVKTLSQSISSMEGVYAQVFTTTTDDGLKKDTDEEQQTSSGSVFDKKSIFEDKSSLIINDDETKLNAPPDFGGGGYNPGGQVSPTVPVDNSFYPLIFLFFAYLLYRLITGYKFYKQNT